MSALELHDVVAGYGRGPDILRGMTLSAELGKTYCIVGPNGAGKSTMLKTVAGLLTPRSGTVRFLDNDISVMRPDQILREGICFVPQDDAVFPEMTVRENLLIGGFLVRDRKLLRQRFDAALELVPDLNKRLGQPAHNLSGGERQMLALGRSLMVEPKMLLVDEPSLGLAPRAADMIFAALARLARELGVAIVMVEQSVKRGLSIADHALVFDMGRNKFEGSPNTILSDPRIKSLYLGRMAQPTRAKEVP